MFELSDSYTSGTGIYSSLAHVVHQLSSIFFHILFLHRLEDDFESIVKDQPLDKSQKLTVREEQSQELFFLHDGHLLNCGQFGTLFFTFELDLTSPSFDTYSPQFIHLLFLYFRAMGDSCYSFHILYFLSQGPNDLIFLPQLSFEPDHFFLELWSFILLATFCFRDAAHGYFGQMFL